MIGFRHDRPRLIFINDFKGYLHHTNLEAHQNVAAAVGMYAAAFSILEQELFVQSAKVFGTDYNGAMSLLGHIQSFTVKLDTVAGFVEHSKLVPEDKKTAKVLLAIAKECNAFRNQILHGVWGIRQSDGKLMLVPFATSTKRKSNAIEMTAEMINARRTSDLDRCIFIGRLFEEGQPLPPKPFRTEPTIVPKA